MAGQTFVGPKNIKIKDLKPNDDQWGTARDLSPEAADAILTDQLFTGKMPSMETHAKGGKVKAGSTTCPGMCKGGKVISSRSV